MTAPKVCEVTACPCCGIEFTTTNPQRKFCSRRCKEAACRDAPGRRSPLLDAAPLRDFLLALDYTAAIDLAAHAGVPERVMRRIRAGEQDTVTVDVADRLLLRTNVPMAVMYPFGDSYQASDGTAYWCSCDELLGLNPKCDLHGKAT